MPVVEMVGITKHFGRVTANDHVDFELEKGEIHALLGENGAGKTTLMRILYGLYQADSGEIRVEGKPVHIGSPRDAIKLGIGMVTQHFALVPPFTVAENVIMGYRESLNMDIRAIEREVASAAARFGIAIDPAVQVRHLSVGQRQRVEILKALFRQAQVLILDEPTAVLVPQEVEALFETLRHLREQGISVVFISHKLNEVMAISDRVTVLRDGRVIDTLETATTTPPALARMMVGRETFGVVRQDAPQRDAEAVLEVQGLYAEDDRGLPAIKDISLVVRAGEILGIAGVGGNGQTELAETLCGIRRPSRGSIRVKGREVAGASPAEMTAAGVGRIPEDRHTGLVGDLTVAENLVMEVLPRFSRYGRLDKKQIHAYAQQLIEQFQIKARPGDRARTLSGGNLQKVLLARVLANQPDVIIAPQPTRGLDVGATEYVHNQLLAQRRRGAAILLISEDLDEIMALSDRIAVIYEGEIVGVLPVEDADVEHLGLLMSGVVKETQHGTAEV
ncbi:MAG: ABC transporter ATP-binding protein [Caldilineae bacterium]|nr:MAG: ABC transporter ATP-binding protein [Caldilineae bacterium]